MAEGGPRAEKTEQPTARRLQKAREDGSVARAHDVAGAVVLVVGAAALGFAGTRLIGRLLQTLHRGLSLDPAAAADPSRLLATAGQIIEPSVAIVVGLLLLLAAVGFAVDVAIGGWVFSSRPLQPDISRLDPVAGFARIFSRTAAVELAKSILKLVIVGAAVFWVAQRWGAGFIGLAAERWPQALSHAASLCSSTLLALAGALAAVTAFEVPYRIWSHRDQLKMSRQELRDEQRELEGNPEIKRRIGVLRRRMARMRMMSEVPKADVVVVNPEHYAAALSYRPEAMRAPRLVAKGTGLIALRIREIAVAHGVPILEAPPLARALCKHVELADEIPAGLYPPVAEVLAYVYRLRTARDAGKPLPSPPRDRRFEPPAEFGRG
jgi:flagellar biosynthetic protein FlhB